MHLNRDTDLLCAKLGLAFVIIYTSVVLNKQSIAILGDSLFCMEEDDNRFEPMCCHYLSGSPCNDILLGAEECTSPFGTYELSMPIDDTIACALNSSLITHKNCREFDVSFCVLIYELNLRKCKE